MIDGGFSLPAALRSKDNRAEAERRAGRWGQFDIHGGIIENATSIGVRTTSGPNMLGVAELTSTPKSRRKPKQNLKTTVLVNDILDTTCGQEAGKKRLVVDDASTKQPNFLQGLYNHDPGLCNFLNFSCANPNHATHLRV